MKKITNLKEYSQVCAILHDAIDTSRSGVIEYCERLMVEFENDVPTPALKVWNADMSQAPKGGTKIVIIDKWGHSAICWFFQGWWQTEDDDLYDETQISAWMLIPTLDI